MARPSTAAVLAGAAVLGVIGGVTAAVTLDDARSEPRPASAGLRSPSTPAARPALLYATRDRIVDGDRTIRHALRAVPLVVLRADGGYVLSTGNGGTPTDPQRLAFVDEDGAATRVATVTGGWDLDPSRTRLVGVDRRTSRVTVYGLDGDVEVTGDRPVDPTTSVAFADGGIVGGEPLRGTDTVLLRVDPDTGRTTREDVGAPAQLGASPDGATLAGTVDLGRRSDPDGSSCLAARPADRARDAWTTCDYRTQLNQRPPDFSPSGRSLLTTPFYLDGFGPPEFAILDAATGPEAVTRIDAPAYALEGSLADDRTVWVHAASHDRSDGTAVSLYYRCTEAGCRRIARDQDLRARLGTTR